MTLRARLLHGVYTERGECVRNDRMNESIASSPSPRLDRGSLRVPRNDIPIGST